MSKIIDTVSKCLDLLSWFTPAEVIKRRKSKLIELKKIKLKLLNGKMNDNTYNKLIKIDKQINKLKRLLGI